MRIVVLGDLAPFVLGGAEQQLSLLVEAWRNAGHEVLVLGHRTPTGLHQGIRARRLHVAYRFGRLIRGGTLAMSLAWNLVRERRRSDVIYCRFLGESAIVAISVKAIGLLQLPLVVAPAAAGEGVHSDIKRLRSLWTWPLWRALLRRHVDAFNAISPAIGEELRQTSLGPISDIPNGVRLPLAHDRSIPVLEDRFWLFCGRLAPQKGIDLLLEAMALATDARFRLEIAGEGPEHAALRADCQRHGLVDRVSFLGRIPHTLLMERMSQAHTLVLPSRYEGLANAALEALSLGLPVLATRCGGIDTYLDGDIGWICEANPQSLAAALSASANVSADDWAERSNRSRALAARSFSIERCAEAHLTLFARIVRGGVPSPDDTHQDSPTASSSR